MKRFLLISLLLILYGLALAAPLTVHSQEKTPELDYKKKGFYLGTGLAGLIGIDGSGIAGAPGKLDFLAGYQFNPYVSVGVDLWTFWFLAYAAEAHVKANFIDAKISPYAVATTGVVGVLNVWDDGGGQNAVGLTYSAGAGVDVHLWRRTTLFAEAKYRGAVGLGDLSSRPGHGAEIGVGFRWMF